MSEETMARVKTVKSQTEARWLYKAQVIMPGNSAVAEYEWIVICYRNGPGLVQPPVEGKDRARGHEDSFEEARKKAIKALDQVVERDRLEG